MTTVPAGLPAIKFEDVDANADGVISVEESKSYLKSVTDMALIKAVYTPVAPAIKLVATPSSIKSPLEQKCTTCSALKQLATTTAAAGKSM
jgi:hypothetical protein